MNMLGAIDPTWWVQPVALASPQVSLSPLLPEHAEALGRAASDGRSVAAVLYLGADATHCC